MSLLPHIDAGAGAARGDRQGHSHRRSPRARVGGQALGPPPLYRQEAIFGRAGLAIARSTLAAWVGVCGVRLQPLVDALKEHVLRCPVVHADETPVSMLAPGTGKTHRAGSFETLRAVVYDFTISRAGEHARAFLGDWKGSLVCDDYGGYKALFARG
jgi:transposase